MKKGHWNELTIIELLVFQSEVINRTPRDEKLEEQIFKELKRRGVRYFYQEVK